MVFRSKMAYFAIGNQNLSPMQRIHRPSFVLVSLTFFFLLALCALPASASLRLPRLVSDGMVLQRHQPVSVWGWAEPGQTVHVTLDPETGKIGVMADGNGRKVRQMRRVEASAVADANGRFELKLPAMKAAGPLTLAIAADDETVRLSDVWVGDVWLLSGQSNIDTHLERVHPQYPDEIDRDSTSRVHLFQVQNDAALDGPRSDVRSAGWQHLSRRTAWHFTALGYFLGKRMATATGVVQGVIQSSWGGTPIEAWLPLDTISVLDPAKADEARLYADPAMRRAAMDANNQASRRWNQLLEEKDPGIAGQWFRPDLDESGWQEADQYQLPIPRGRFCGTYWLRQHVQVDAAHAGQRVRLLLGTLIDADFTYVNGRLVGQTGYQYPPRRYDLPEGVLHEGDNVITVRFVNRSARPEFISQKPYQLKWADGTVQPLSARWLCHDGTQMPSQPSMNTSFQNMAGAEFNGMLLPLAPYALAGVVWYQGESNTDRPERYQRRLESLMATWRQTFRQPDLPFVVVQLPDFMAPSASPQESSWARLRESQRRVVLATDHAELAVTLGLGEANDIHPLRKKEVAERVAQVFDRLVYGKPVMLAPKPVRAEAKTDGTVVVTFDQPVAGTHGFELDTDGRFRNVEAETAGKTVLLKGTGTRVRYAWKDNPVEADCHAANTQALPATPFELEVVK